jgi:hypothetical protein
MRNLFILLAAAPLAALADPIAVNHAGRLLDSNDAPVNAPALGMQFRIYTTLNVGDSLEELVWESSTCTVEVKNGYFSVTLGQSCSGTPSLDSTHLPASAARFLELTLDGAKLLPRLALTPAPVAAVARNSERLGGLDLDALDDRYDARFAAAAGAYALLSPANAQQGSLNVTGNVTAAAFNGGGAGLTGLDADELSTGTVPGARLAGTYPNEVHFTGTGSTFAGAFSGDGSGLTGIPWSGIAAGALPDARLSGTYTGAVTFAGPVTFTGAVAGAVQPQAGTADPQPSSCSSSNPGALYVNTASGQMFYCSGSAWKKVNFRPAMLVLDAVQVDFGNVLPSAAGSRTVKLSNPGDEDATSLNIAVSGAGFSQSSTTCGTTLAAGAMCDIGIALANSGSPGARAGTLTVTSANAGQASATLTGTYDLRTFYLHLDGNATDADGIFSFVASNAAVWDTGNYAAGSASLKGNIYYNSPAQYALSTPAHTAWSLAQSNPDWEFTWYYRHTGDSGYGTVVFSNTTAWAGSVDTYIKSNVSTSTPLPSGWMISVYWGATYVEFNSSAGVVRWTYPGYHSSWKQLKMRRSGTTLEFFIDGVSQGTRAAPNITSATAAPLYVMGSPNYAYSGYGPNSYSLTASLDEARFHSP